MTEKTGADFDLSQDKKPGMATVPVSSVMVYPRCARFVRLRFTIENPFKEYHKDHQKWLRVRKPCLVWRPEDVRDE